MVNFIHTILAETARGNFSFFILIAALGQITLQIVTIYIAVRKKL